MTHRTSTPWPQPMQGAVKTFLKVHLLATIVWLGSQIKRALYREREARITGRPHTNTWLLPALRCRLPRPASPMGIVNSRSSPVMGGKSLLRRRCELSRRCQTHLFLWNRDDFITNHLGYMTTRSIMDLNHDVARPFLF